MNAAPHRGQACFDLVVVVVATVLGIVVGLRLDAVYMFGSLSRSLRRDAVLVELAIAHFRDA